MNQRFSSLLRIRGTATSMAAVILVAMIAIFGFAGTAFAAYGGYAIDGSVPDAGTTQFNDLYGSVDELGPMNGSSTKLLAISSDAPPTLDYTNPNNQTDLRRVWMDTNTDANNDVWLYFAWERDSNSGSGVIMFEFEKAGVPVGCNYAGTEASLIANCNPFSGRQPGDFIISWDQQGGNLDLVRRDFTFTDNNPSNGQWDGAAAEPLKLGTAVTLNSTYTKAAYDSTGYFGEAAINLTGSGIFPASPTSCLTIANVIPSTITGNSDTADYKDIVLGDFGSVVNISSCGQVKVTKKTVPAGETGSFPYTVKRTDNSAVEYGTSPAISKSGTLTGDNDSDLYGNLKAGSNYTLTEGSLTSPWALSAIICSANGNTYNVYPGNQTFNVVPSITTSCVITNEIQMGKLVVVKNLTNDNGGTKAKNDFDFTVTGSFPVNNGQPQAFSASGITTLTVPVGSYSVTEGAAAGYTTTYSPSSCTNLQVTKNGTTTCTITNDDQPGTLIVKKVLVKDNGGTGSVEDFSFSVNGGTAVAFEADGQNNLTVNAGTYSITETAASGYATSYSNCSNVVVPNGGTATCTITNNDQPGTLLVKKVVVNDNGGTKNAHDFSFSVNGGAAVAFEADGQNDLTVNAGTYSITETAASGYMTSYSNCSNVVVPNGGTATCTITNNDKAPSLTLVKEVLNNNGGNALASSWTLSATGATSFFGPGPSVTSGANFAAGTYILAEVNGPEGYSSLGWSCVGDGQQNGASITLGLNESATCTVTNDDDAPGLKLVKKASPSTYSTVGTIINYTYTLTNTGQATLSQPFAVTDDKATVTCPAVPTSIATGGHITCTATYVITQADLDAGSVTNVAQAQAKDSFDNDVFSNQDEETVTAEQNPVLVISKDAEQTSYDAAGDVITYTLVATNTGNVTLHNVTIEDTKIAVLNCIPTQPATLAPSASITCTGSYTTSQADVDAGKVDNTATADSDETTPVDDSETVPAIQNPALTITKDATQENYDAAGDVITYTLVATNTGNVTLHNVIISDTKIATLVCVPTQPTILARGASITCTGSYITTQADVDVGKVDNTATADSDETTPVNDSETVPAIQNPALVISKDAEQTSYDAAGDVITYTLVATNTGNVTLHNVTISDPKLPALSCTLTQPTTLVPGASITCTGSYTTTQADVDAGKVDNTATADSDETTPTNDSETVPAEQNPALVISKDAVQENYDAAGDTISYTLVATNTGNVTLHNVTISDTKIATLLCTPAQPTTLVPGASITCTGTYITTQADVDTGKVDNTATADSNETDPATDSETVPAEQHPALVINKDAEQTSYDASGDVITYTLVATNTGNITLHGVEIEDTKIAVLSCTPTQPTTLAPGASITCTGTYTTTQADMDAGKVDNTATADSDETTPTNDSETVPAEQHPSITITKDAEQTSYDEAGDVISYTLVATNTGNVTLHNVTIEDTKIATLVCVPTQPTILAPGASITCTGSYTTTKADVDTGKVDNTATADSDETTPVNDSETVPAEQHPSITITKDAEQTSYDASGDVITYTLVTTNTGNVTLHNVTISDTKLAALVCVPAQPTTLAPGASITCTGSYTTTQADVDTGKVDNTATADSDETGPTTDSETVPAEQHPTLVISKDATQDNYDAAGDVISYTIVATNTGNITLHNVTIEDTKIATLLCTPTQPTILVPGASITCTGSYTTTQADVDAGKVDNTATADSDETEPVTDSETVPALQNPALVISKDAEQTSYDAAGDVISYTLVATNTGNITLHNVTIEDNKIATLVCVPTQPATLAPGASITCIGSYTTSQVDVDAGKVDNTAAADSDESEPDSDDETVPAEQHPALVVSKDAGQTSYDAAGDVITYTLVATNTGNITLHNVTVSDPKLVTLLCTPTQPTTLAPGASITCTGSYTTTQADVDTGKVDNTATADSDETTPVNDSETVPAEQHPTLVISKDAEQTSYDAAGDVITYTLIATNTGNITLHNVIISDPKLPVLSCTLTLPATLVPGASITCTGSYTTSHADVDAGKVDNTATADSDESEPDSDDETVPAEQNPALVIDKTGDVGPVTIGDTVHYTITVRNTGNMTIDNVTVQDAKLGINQNIGSLKANESTQITGSYGPVTEGDLPGPIFNSAGVTGTLPTGEPTTPVTDTHEVPVTINAALSIKKYTNGEDADSGTGPVVAVGSTVTWTYVVANVGNVSLSNIVVTDDQGVTPVYAGGDADNDGKLDLNESWTYQATGVATEGQYVNVGTAKGTPPVGGEVTATDTSHYFGLASTPELASLGDTVWFDTNKNGLQDNGEAGVTGVVVNLYTSDGNLVTTATTDGNGKYLFTNLQPGSYYVEFATVQGYNFTHYNVGGVDQDGADSDPLVPTVDVTISDGGVEGELGVPLTYTFFYTNTDATTAATNVVISTTIPAGTSFVADSSNPGWVCTDSAAGGVCKLTLATLAANTSGSATFVVLLNANEPDVPDMLDIFASLTQDTLARTEVVTLGSGETNLTIDAGVILTQLSLTTPTPTAPTSLPDGDQPQQQFIFLPSVQSEE